MGDFVKFLIEGLLKVGLLKLGLILALFGAGALTVPDAWLLEQKVESNNTIAAILLLLGLCMIAAWAFTSDLTCRTIRTAKEKSKSRSEFTKLSNKARLLLVLQARSNSEQINVVVTDAAIQELIRAPGG